MAAGNTLACENCKRITQPRPVPVGLFVEGRLLAQRHLCSACRVHVVDSFQSGEQAPWLSTRIGARS